MVNDHSRRVVRCLACLYTGSMTNLWPFSAQPTIKELHNASYAQELFNIKHIVKHYELDDFLTGEFNAD